MATNSARGNPIAAADGPQVANQNPPPPASKDTKALIQETTPAGATGTHEAGQDVGLLSTAGTGKVKPAKELEEEERKNA